MTASDAVDNFGSVALNPSDQQLWNQFRSGNSQALFTLYKRLHVPLVNYSFRLCGDKQQAQDSFSELMMALWDKRERLTDVKNVKSYLMTTLRRQLLSELKTKQQFEMVAEYTSDTEVSYEDVIINAQEQEKLKQQLRHAFSKLTPRQRQFITLRFYDGMDYKEIAAHTGVDIKAVYNKVYEGIKLLRQNLPEDFKDSPALFILMILFKPVKPVSEYC